ncbi:hypothetical protein ROZALSC1DRAFT_26075, partial [Rozella allomycis CSF55]
NFRIAKSLIALVILTRVPFSLEVPVQQVPTAVADKEPLEPIADDAMETDSLDEIDYDEDVGDITPKIATQKCLRAFGLHWGVISAVHKLYPKMYLKPSDLNNIEEYLQRFRRIFKDINLNTEQTKQLLRLFSYNNESVAQWFVELHKLILDAIFKGYVFFSLLSSSTQKHRMKFETPRPLAKYGKAAFHAHKLINFDVCGAEGL